ncbi:hypothetical protein [Picosynechococcus sp. PCC 7002]|nr:hypothetical protein [Picosynechococcus sp. PCC 7002]
MSFVLEKVVASPEFFWGFLFWWVVLKSRGDRPWLATTPNNASKLAVLQ